MRSFWACRADPPQHQARIHPALTSYADECFGILARLTAYVATLAVFAMAGVHLWDLASIGDDVAEPSAKAGWRAAPRSHPAFSVGRINIPAKTESYAIFRHPDGGRKDILRWSAAGERPVVAIEIYRPGGELSLSAMAETDIAAAIDPLIGAGRGEFEAAGVLDSKFGTVALLRHAGEREDASSCLGFVKRLDDPELQISGWSCQGSTLPARRAAIGCMLERLGLLTAGKEPKLAEVFARAELRRGNCTDAALSAVSTDWITGMEKPRLRGSL